MLKELIAKGGRRSVALVVLLMAPLMMLWAQEMNEKYSMTTQMFLNELKEKAEQPTARPHRVPGLKPSDKMLRLKNRRLIASPDTVGGVAYISCFIHLKNPADLSEVRSLGVEVEETFDGLDFVTARVPVNQLEPLAGVDNVTRIKVAQCMRPMTDVAKQKTNVDDLLTQSPDAIAKGIPSKYDGTGVVLGIIDTGIDFQHIAFKDKDGNSRIKRAYVYNGSSATEYTVSNINEAETDDKKEDHGTHTASTAGGSSVIVNGSTVTVTDDHANATYGGMAPGADLYLAGINELSDTYLTNALNRMVTYADAQGKPLVVSNSWGSGWGPRDGTGEWADLVATHFGDSHPNHIILFASSNDAGHSKDNEGGGFFVKKSSASSSSPLGTILRSASYSNTDAGYKYKGLIACAWSSSRPNCRIYVLDSSTGEVKTYWTVTQNNTQTFSGLDTYYDGSMTVYIESSNGKYRLAVYSANGLETQSSSGSSYHKSKYTLAIEVYPANGSSDINMWAGNYSYFTNHLPTNDHTWTEGTDDMCVSDEATIPNAISVGAYVSKTNVKNYQGTNYSYSSGNLDDIADFSSYATATQSPTEEDYPWITAPGAQLVAGVNHYHTTLVDSYSYYASGNKSSLVVNSSTNPYGVMQGTSMATPVAAGIVALWLQASLDENAAHKNLTVNDVKTIMEQTAINDSYTTTGPNASHFGKGKIDALAGIQYILQATPVPPAPYIIAEPETLTFTAGVNEQDVRTIEVLAENLTEDINVTLTDANNVFSIDKTSISKTEAEDGAIVTVTFESANAGTYNGTVTLSSAGAEDVVITLTTEETPTSDPNTKMFKKVTSASDLQSGMRYIIACGSQNKAAGDVGSGAFLSDVSITLSNDIITITDDVAVFVLEEKASGWSFKNESTNQYLQSTAAKNVSYTNSEVTWTLSNGTDGVIMTCGSSGTMLYNVNSPRFTTYTSNPSATMIQANLYMEYSDNNPPVVKQDVTMAFSPASATATVGEDFTEPTLTTTPDNLTVTYSSSDETVATVNSSTGAVTLVAAGTTTITATFAGNDDYNSGSASYSLTVNATASDSNEFALITKAADFVEGDYIIVYDNGALNTTVSSNRLQYTEVTPSSNVIKTNNAAIIWHIAPSGDYYTIYNADAGKYAASKGTANQAQLLDSGTDDKSLWTVSTGSTFDFTNKYNSENSINATLRRNGTYGFACYSTQTGGALRLYKKTSDSDEDYYQSADGKSGSALKTAMSEIILPHTVLGYNDLWTAYSTTDVRSDGKICDMYSNATNYEPGGSAQGANFSGEGDSYNREHSFPKSWFGGEVTPMFTDLHHIYPTDGYINNRRSNYPYGETDGGTYKSANDFSKLGTCTYPGYTGTVFEPADEYKGDFARTYFYMVTCYEDQLPTWYSTYSSSTEVDDVLDGNKYPGLQAWQLEMLMKWAKDDPVSDKETARNNAVYDIQANRNPFIDYPGLEEYIWGSMTTTAFSYDNYVQPTYHKQDVTMTFSPASATATVGDDFTEPTLTTTPDNLTVTYSSSNTSVATVNSGTGEVTLVAAGETTITATFAGDDDYNSGSASYTLTVSAAPTPEPIGTGIYALVTDASSLAAGDKIIIVNTTAERALSTTQSNNNRPAAVITINDDNTITPEEDVQIITLEKDGDNFLFNVGDSYLYAASSSGNQMKTEVNADDNAKATISISNDDATIVFQGSNTRNHIRYNPNSGSPIFSCYASTSDMAKPQIYREILNLTLNDNENNSSIITAYNGHKANVTLNRTLQAGGWNTFCAPFDIDAETLSGKGITAVKTLTESDLEDSKLTLTFGDAESIEAGKPYLVKVSSTLANPTFEAVTVKSGTTDTDTYYADFKPVMTPTELQADDHSVLFVKNGNSLTYPTSTGNMNSFRAYFQLKNGADVYAQTFAMNFDDITTEIWSLTPSHSPEGEESVYDLQGRKIANSQKPTAKGIYIVNGRKIVIK